MRNILFLGMPGVGKSTYAKRVAKYYKIPSVSPGVLLRKEVNKGTPLGKMIKKYIDKGDLVPDLVADKIFISRLKRHDCKKGFILDGILSKLERAELLYNHITIDQVIYFKVPKKVLLKRISARRKRSDDTQTVIEHRIEIYKKRTASLRKLYKKQGILNVIDASPPIDEVIKQAINIIDLYNKRGKK